MTSKGSVSVTIKISSVNETFNILHWGSNFDCKNLQCLHSTGASQYEKNVFFLNTHPSNIMSLFFSNKCICLFSRLVRLLRKRNKRILDALWVFQDTILYICYHILQHIDEKNDKVWEKYEGNTQTIKYESNSKAIN